MKKLVKIDGMMCHHCEMRVEKSLLSMKEVKNAKADHVSKQCVIELKKDVTDEVIKEKVADAGYQVTSIEVLS